MTESQTILYSSSQKFEHTYPLSLNDQVCPKFYTKHLVKLIFVCLKVRADDMLQLSEQIKKTKSNNELTISKVLLKL